MHFGRTLSGPLERAVAGFPAVLVTRAEAASALVPGVRVLPWHEL